MACRPLACSSWSDRSEARAPAALNRRRPRNFPLPTPRWHFGDVSPPPVARPSGSPPGAYISEMLCVHGLPYLPAQGLSVPVLPALHMLLVSTIASAACIHAVRRGVARRRGMDGAIAAGRPSQRLGRHIFFGRGNAALGTLRTTAPREYKREGKEKAPPEPRGPSPSDSRPCPLGRRQRFDKPPWRSS